MKIKKYIIFVIFLVLFSNLSKASDTIKIDLKSNNLGPNQNFEGNINFNFSGNITTSENFNLNIDSASTSSITLYELFYNSSIKPSIIKGLLSRVGDPFTDKKIIIGKSSVLFGLLLPSNTRSISAITFGVSGSGGPLLIDANNDGIYDYKYRSNIESYSSSIYPIGVETNIITDGFAIISGNQNNKRCETFNITFEKLYNETQIELFVNTKKEQNGSNLTLSFESKTCDIDSNLISENNYNTYSCKITLTNLDSSSYQGCVYVKTGSSITNYFKVPSRGDKNYYSLTVKTANYKEDLLGGGVVYDTKLKNKINENLASCTNNCLVYMNASLNSDGELNVNNIFVRDAANIDYNSFYLLSKTDDYFVVNGSYKLDLSKISNLKTPNQKGLHTLKVKFRNLEASISFNISDVPVAIIDVNPKKSVVGSEISFSGEKSSSINGKISKYFFDFGDGVTSSSSKVTHTYLKNGDFSASLYVEDEKGIRSPKVTTNIKIVSFDEVIPGYINETNTKIVEAQNYYQNSKGETREVLDLINYNNNIKSYSTNASTLEKEYYQLTLNSSDDKKKNIYFSLNNIRNSIPEAINFYSYEKSDDKPFLDDLVDISYFKRDLSNEAKISFRNSIYTYNQNNINVKTKIYYLDVDYPIESKNITLIKKQITYGVDTTKIIENLKGINPNSVISIKPSDYVFDKEFNVLVFDAKSDLEEDISYVILEKTDEVPSTLIYNGKPPVENLYSCGDNFCTEPYENVENCAIDCKKKRPISFYIILGLVVILGVYYFNFYKGKGNYRDLGNYLAIKIAGRRIFTNKRDLESLDAYVKLKLTQGFKEGDIRGALLKKGWTIKQIDFAFERSKK